MNGRRFWSAPAGGGSTAHAWDRRLWAKRPTGIDISHGRRVAEALHHRRARSRDGPADLRVVRARQLSLFRLVQRLNASSWRTRAGNKYWSPTTVARILRNPIYIGRWYVNRAMAVEPTRPRISLAYRKNPKSAVRLRPREDWIEITVPAIIDSNLFERAQAQRAVNAR